MLSFTFRETGVRAGSKEGSISDRDLVYRREPLDFCSKASCTIRQALEKNYSFTIVTRDRRLSLLLVAVAKRARLLEAMLNAGLGRGRISINRLPSAKRVLAFKEASLYPRNLRYELATEKMFGLDPLRAVEDILQTANCFVYFTFKSLNVSKRNHGQIAYPLYVSAYQEVTPPEGRKLLCSYPLDRQFFGAQAECNQFAVPYLLTGVRSNHCYNRRSGSAHGRETGDEGLKFRDPTSPRIPCDTLRRDRRLAENGGKQNGDKNCRSACPKYFQSRPQANLPNIRAKHKLSASNSYRKYNLEPIYSEVG